MTDFVDRNPFVTIVICILIYWIIDSICNVIIKLN